MDSPYIDIDFLAKETMALSEALKGSEDFGQPSLFDGDFQFSKNEEVVVEVSEESSFDEKLPQEIAIDFEEEGVEHSLESVFPVSPGLIFKIDSGVSTFCVRGILCHNINESVHSVMNDEEGSWKKLKINDREELSGIHYFETSSIEQSEMIAEYILNKRFPIQEEMVCNLSDPGFSWWLESNENGMKVYFKAQSVERDQQFMRLGPIGDRGISSLKFSKCEGLLRRLFSISEYSTSDKSFEIKPFNLNDSNFLNFKDIFEKGEFNFEFDPADLTVDHQRLVIFLQEVAAVRGFWISVEEILNNNP
ncbi:hypothetical protein [Halobacteriovorax sp. JY17]|uniref:hypothetical protein n=1 Tax=Halobacteriovorax sp. JY17 TaxID=2014617 RepID=UPI000C5F6F03|nr:hypothetical protein [Halobacteriovorax sp. JY17]PIK16549.1 MAG: hypothetical protein CES88_07350 [Halobacteriovorax sp. JY17]